MIVIAQANMDPLITEFAKITSELGQLTESKNRNNSLVAAAELSLKTSQAVLAAMRQENLISAILWTAEANIAAANATLMEARQANENTAKQLLTAHHKKRDLLATLQANSVESIKALVDSHPNVVAYGVPTITPAPNVPPNPILPLPRPTP